MIKKQIEAKAKLKKQSLAHRIESGVPEGDPFGAVQSPVPTLKD